MKYTGVYILRISMCVYTYDIYVFIWYTCIYTHTYI